MYVRDVHLPHLTGTKCFWHSIKDDPQRVEMVDKKRVLLAVTVTVAALSVALYGTGQMSVTAERFVGNQYTPWDTERAFKYSDAVIYGTVLGAEKVVREEIEYIDDTDRVEKTRKMPYQILQIKVDESFKGGLDGTVQVRDNLDAIVTENGERIQVRYDNSISYEGGESGIFFIEKIDGEYVLDGHYGFLKRDGMSLKSGFLGDATPANIENAIQNLSQQYD